MNDEGKKGKEMRTRIEWRKRTEQNDWNVRNASRKRKKWKRRERGKRVCCIALISDGMLIMNTKVDS